MSQYPDRGRRLEHQEKAYQLQLKGGIEGAIKYTIYGTLVCILAHRTWPLFRKQTLALKAFLVSSATVTGLTIGADNYLLKYEHHQRQNENDIRRQARNDLAKQGVIATETEIRRWKERKEAEIKRNEENASAGASASASVDGKASTNAGAALNASETQTGLDNKASQATTAATAATPSPTVEVPPAEKAQE